jgi:TPR repeat protein
MSVLILKLYSFLGCPDSRYQLANRYASGWGGVEKDHKKSLRLYRMAAEQGHAPSQYELGIMYYEGIKTEQDYYEAARLLHLAAAKGHPAAQGLLGNMYYRGEGVSRNFGQAAKFYRIAAMQGNVFAQENLGSMYEDGEGVLQDFVRAHMWYNVASASYPAPEWTEGAVANRDNVAAKMTPAQIAEAQEMARKCQASNFKQCD